MLSKILAEKREEAVKQVCLDPPSVSKPLKEKTTKAERRALQEAQRAAKAASKGYSYDSFPDLNFFLHLVKLTGIIQNFTYISEFKTYRDYSYKV